MAIVKLDQQAKEVVVTADAALRHPVIFEYFDSIAASEYDSALERALVLGCYALQLDEIGQMLDNAARDVNGELMRLKVLFELRGLRERGAAKGDVLEADLAEVLQTYADVKGWADAIARTGNQTGALPRRKVGDLVISVSDSDRSIVVEAKFDKGVPFGEPSSTDKAATSESSAQGQNYLALANRLSDFSIFVVDVQNCHPTIRREGSLVFLPEQPGFVAVVDRARGDWSSLHAAYGVARVLCLAGRVEPEDWKPIDLIAKRLGRTLAHLTLIDKSLDTIGTSANSILKQLQEIEKVRATVTQEVDQITSALSTWATAPVTARDRLDLFLGPS